MGQYSRITNRSIMLRVTALLVMAVSSVLAINFPSSSRPSRPSSPARDRLVFSRQTFSTASCTDSSQSLSTIVLSPGEGRVFQSPNYPANYPDGQACTYNFEPAVGAQLVFSCSDVDLTATSSPGALCTGDYLRYSTVQYSTVQETISGSMTRPECSDSRGPGTASLTAQPSPTPPTSRSSSRRTMTAPQGKVTMQDRVADTVIPPEQYTDFGLCNENCCLRF